MLQMHPNDHFWNLFAAVSVFDNANMGNLQNQMRRLYV